jgi:hypothetical protein
MKRIAFYLIMLAVAAACNRSTGDAPKAGDTVTTPDKTSTKVQLVPEDTLYGPAFEYDKRVDITELLKDESKLDTTKNYIVEATVTQVCQRRGCWFRVDDGKGGSVFVKLIGASEEEDELTIPMNGKGRRVIFYGMPAIEMVSVKAQKHFLEDAGASKADIDAVKEPKKELRFYATSVVVLHQEKSK